LDHPKKINTDIPGFDQITGGGLPRSSAIALIGEGGAGKELLTRHMVWNLLQKEAKILYFTVDQSAEELRYYMLNYGWDIQPFEENKLLHIVDVFSYALDKFREEQNSKDENFFPFDINDVSKISYHKSLYDVGMLTREGVKFYSLRSIILNRNQFRLVIFDSISPLLLTHDESIFQMIHTLKFATRHLNTSGIALLHSDIHNDKSYGMMKSLADVIIEIRRVGSSHSAILLQKYPGVINSSPFPLEINEQGVNIITIQMPDLLFNSQ